MQYIYTCQKLATELANYELSQLNENFEFIKKLDEGVSLFSINLNNNTLIDLINNKPLVFIRHLFAVDISFEKEIIFEDLITTCVGLAISNLNLDHTFSIQIRENINTMNHSIQKNLKETLADNLNKLGYILDVKNPQQILSFFITNDQIYFGISPTSLNLSNWNGGMRHYRHDKTLISRAEYKLQEAFEVFDLNFSDYKSALDLGAAPGGWSNILLKNNIKVTAIDPAKLSPVIVKHPKLTHYKETTQTYLAKNPKQQFDLIVNDMKMNVFNSLKILDEFYFNLKDNGTIITTIKLPDNNYNYSFIETILKKTENNYQLVRARQLFHNRSEITIILKK